MARSISAKAISGFVRAVRYLAGTPARFNRARLLVQLSGRNSRNASMTGTSPRASVSDTSVWQLAATPIRFERLARATEFHYNVTLRQGVQQALLTFFDYGTFERFPTLRLGVLESGMGWLGPLLDRCDAVFATISGRAVPIHRKPSDIFARQCFISGDPDETAAPLLFDHVGAHLFMWATDYPHPDHPSTWVDALGRQVAGLSEQTRTAFLGGNVKRIYKLS